MTKSSRYLRALLLLPAMWMLLAASQAPVAGDGVEERQQDVSAGEVKQKVVEAGKSISSYTAEQRDEAISKAGKELAELDVEIDQLQEKLDEQWDHLSSEARKKWQESLIRLRKMRIDTAEWYGAVKSGSADAWTEIKKGYNEAYLDLSQAWSDAKKEFAGTDAPEPPKQAE